jgi:hypothetical protein
MQWADLRWRTRKPPIPQNEVEWLCRARKALPSLKTSDGGLEGLPLLEVTGGGVCWADKGTGGGRVLSSVLEIIIKI